MELYMTINSTFINIYFMKLGKKMDFRGILNSKNTGQKSISMTYQYPNPSNETSRKVIRRKKNFNFRDPVLTVPLHRQVTT